MALLDSFEKSGNYLFRYRGQAPVILFIAAVPVIWYTGEAGLNGFWQRIISIACIVVSLSGFWIRAYTIATTPKGTSGRNTQGQVADSLNTSGIYSMVRHPLYLGNYLIWAGMVGFTYNIWFFIILSLAFWIYYERIMFSEERFLERKFGKEYLTWAEKVPAFLPDFHKYTKSMVGFSLKSVFRREYSGLLATVTGFAFIDHMRYFFLNGNFDPWRISTYCFLGALFITLLFRTLKHQTNLLTEKDRS